MLSPSAQTADTLGWILVTSGKPQTGVALLRQASAQGHDDPRILYHYAVALNDTGNKADAIEVLKAVVSAQGELHREDRGAEAAEPADQGRMTIRRWGVPQWD